MSVSVVLGHLMSATGELSNESKRRVLKLVECIKDKENQLIFFCGWDYRNDSNIKLAKALSDFFIKQKPSAHKIILLESSRDTVGDAVLLKYYFENHIAEKITLLQAITILIDHKEYLILFFIKTIY